MNIPPKKWMSFEPPFLVIPSEFLVSLLFKLVTDKTILEIRQSFNLVEPYWESLACVPTFA
jgi:hypothetical protein